MYKSTVCILRLQPDWPVHPLILSTTLCEHHITCSLAFALMSKAPKL